MMNVMGASDKLMQIMNVKPKVNNTGKDTIENCDGHLELRNVKFTYPSKDDVQVLKGVSLGTDSTKRVVAICGTSGCGKSSIIAMIERFYDPVDGQILFNGRDIRELEMGWYH
jgi:ATP-binding cassette subfamily B (MDR/TAP) protein 1